MPEDFFADDFLREDFLAEAFFAEDFFAEDFFAEDFFAEPFLAPDVPPELRAADVRAAGRDSLIIPVSESFIQPLSP